ncbi:hypothetical protein F7U66_11065 [Vibrio parahaemolyticus]|nr:hypothetical protein [Vibrio parahaemolyticus]
MKKLALKFAIESIIDMDKTTFSNDPFEVYDHLVKQAETDGGYDPKIVLQELTATVRATGLVERINYQENTISCACRALLGDIKENMVKAGIDDQWPTDLTLVHLPSLVSDKYN